MSDRLASALGASTCNRTPDQSAFGATTVNTWSAFRYRRGSAESVGQSHLVFKIGSLHSRPGEERNNPNTPLGGHHSSAIHRTKDEAQRDQDLERGRDAPLRARHIIIAFNLAGFKPGSFFNTATYNAGPIAANVGFTYRF